MEKILEFDAVLVKNPDMDAAYIEVPFDIKEIFGKSRLPGDVIHVTLKEREKPKPVFSSAD